jgi:hypothetical protein
MSTKTDFCLGHGTSSGWLGLGAVGIPENLQTVAPGRLALSATNGAPLLRWVMVWRCHRLDSAVSGSDIDATINRQAPVA